MFAALTRETPRRDGAVASTSMARVRECAVPRHAAWVRAGAVGTAFRKEVGVLREYSLWSEYIVVLYGQTAKDTRPKRINLMAVGDHCMRMRNLSIPVFLILLSSASVVCADTPPPPPERYEIHSPSHKYVATLDPETGTEVRATSSSKVIWTSPHWYRAAFLSDDGDHFVTEYDGGNLIPQHYRRDFRFNYLLAAEQEDSRSDTGRVVSGHTCFEEDGFTLLLG
jgi:hypothetical protein